MDKFEANDEGRIAFIQSAWHGEVVDAARESFVAEMTELGLSDTQIDFFQVAGAFEIPLHAKRLASSGRFAAIVAAGLVVDGGIYRHEFVADAVISGLMRVQLDCGVPIVSAVLTPHHFHEHGVHQDFYREHLHLKGQEAARACASTVRSLAQIPSPV